MKQHPALPDSQPDKMVIDRRQFIAAGCSLLLNSSVLAVNKDAAIRQGGQLRVVLDFPGAGGMIEAVDPVHRAIRFRAHREKDGGWGQVWWYFRIDGLTPDQEISLELNLDVPLSLGVAPQAYFSTDQKRWQMTAPGREMSDGDMKLIVYHQKADAPSMWFAYNQPYLPSHADELMTYAQKAGKGIQTFDLCRTNKGRSVKALQLSCPDDPQKRIYSIWLQARTHAFESGASWVLHELALWLISSDPEARLLRSQTHITIVPIVDVDSVTDGRTGKNQIPHDHNRDWQQEPPHWPEIKAIKEKLRTAGQPHALDLFVDIHGPGNGRQPYFIVPKPELLKSNAQQKNQAAFLNALQAEPFTAKSSRTPSMTQFYYSARDINHQAAAGWAATNSGPSVVAVTMEVNMHSSLSTAEGYQEEGIALGRGIAKYFVQGLHIH